MTIAELETVLAHCEAAREQFRKNVAHFRSLPDGPTTRELCGSYELAARKADEAVERAREALNRARASLN